MPRPTTFVGMTEGTTNHCGRSRCKREKEEKRKCPMDEHVEATILFGIYLGGTVASLVGVFMWQGPWAALAAVGLLAVLFAMSQTIVMATNVGARTILRAISGAGR